MIMPNGKNSLHPGDVEIFAEMHNMVVMVDLKNLGGHVSVNFQLDPYIALAFATKLLEAAQEILKEQKDQIPEPEPEPKLDSPLKLCKKCSEGHMIFQSTSTDRKQEAYKCSKCGHGEIWEVP